MSDEDEQLPGEISEEAQKLALEALGLTLIRASMDGMEDHFLTAVVAIYHEEWERRHGESWVIAE